MFLKFIHFYFLIVLLRQNSYVKQFTQFIGLLYKQNYAIITTIHFRTFLSP